jgi:transcriptional regulator with XRE-family HTH domain
LSGLTPRQSSCYDGGMARSHTPRKLRTLAPGVSLGELSRRTGIRLEHLSRIVRNKRGLTVDAASRIARALNTTIDDVVSKLAA